MVAEQVLRKAVALVAIAVAPGLAAADVPLAVIDVGPGDRATRRARREALERELAGVQGIAPVGDPELKAALAGEAYAPQRAAGQRALEAARTAFGKPDCPGAEREAEAALMSLSAAQAAGAEVAAELRQAYVYRFLCADQRADAAAARAAAGTLRTLGSAEPPEGVGDAVWSRYPAVDATMGIRHVDLAVETRPTGAAVWIDHRLVGKGPITAVVTEGEHLVAAARPDGGAVAARSSGARIALAIPLEKKRWQRALARVRGWQSRASKRDAVALDALMSSARIGYAVVIDERGRFTVWQRRGQLRHLGNATDAIGVGGLVADAETRRKNPGIDPDRPLLRETSEERAAYLARREGKSATPTRQEWWVYAAIIGAVALGAGVVLANDLGDDHQRIEITFP
jgi:hypothetical protein